MNYAAEFGDLFWRVQNTPVTSSAKVSLDLYFKKPQLVLLWQENSPRELSSVAAFKSLT